MKTVLLIGALAAVCIAGAQTVKLHPVPSGFMPKTGGYMPLHLRLSFLPPIGGVKLPAGLTNVKYGVLPIGGKNFTVCVGDLPGKPEQLFVDTNGNGDLTDDPPVVWKAGPEGKYTMHTGSAKVDFHLAGSNQPVSLGFYKFDPNDPQRVPYRYALMYFSDYGYSGEVQLKGKKMPLLLSDDFVTGDFSGKADKTGSGVRLLIDRNDDGKFNEVGKSYDSHKQFALYGTTYELTKIPTTGKSVTFTVSSTTVKEIPLPLSYKVGAKFPGFSAATMDSKPVDFPTTYKGHVVLLDFWATWCGPCMAEVPNITAAYSKFHNSGFDILGVSLDKKDMAKQVVDVANKKNMNWPQIYDGLYWDAAVAVKYGIQGIPHSFLVDGDTGVLIADGDALRGPGFAKVVEAALTKKGLLKAQ